MTISWIRVKRAFNSVFDALAIWIAVIAHENNFEGIAIRDGMLCQPVAGTWGDGRPRESKAGGGELFGSPEVKRKWWIWPESRGLMPKEQQDRSRPSPRFLLHLARRYTLVQYSSSSAGAVPAQSNSGSPE